MKKQVICVGISNGCFTQYSMSGKNTSEAMNKNRDRRENKNKTVKK